MSKKGMRIKEFKLQYALGTINEKDLRILVILTKSPIILETLSMHLDPDIRCGVSGNPRTPSKSLEGLATDDFYHIRLNAIRNTAISIDSLERVKKCTKNDMVKHINTMINIKKDINEHKTEVKRKVRVNE